MYPFVINDQSYLLGRSLQELPNIDLIAWLKSQPLYPKIFWKEQDSQITRAAVGNLLSFSDIPKFSDSPPFDVRLYGGIRFSQNLCDDPTWKGFPNTSFWLPQIEISQEEGRTQAVIYSLNKSLSPPEILQNFAQNTCAPSYSLKSRLETPHFQDWQKQVGSVLDSIQSGYMDKLVLARKTTLECSSPISPWEILFHLKEKARRATLFAFQLSPDLCFLGATPEKLFRREANLCITDAVAATRPRGSTPEEDMQFEKDLLGSDKEQREFKIVKDYLDLKLLPLSEEMKWDGDDRILKASHVQHLHNRLNATLKNSVTDADLVCALHPTPALGGFPREKSLAFLKQIEPFDRGWYGGPIGVIGTQSSSLYVAIRSALINEHLLHLFAGTGLVPGSIAEREWEELEQKIRPFTELFTKA